MPLVAAPIPAKHASGFHVQFRQGGQGLFAAERSGTSPENRLGCWQFEPIGLKAKIPDVGRDALVCRATFQNQHCLRLVRG